MMLEHEQAVLRANALDFSLQRRGNLARSSIGDDGDPLLRLQSKTNLDRIACARDQFRINRMEISAIRHTESCENYAEIQRRQIYPSAPGDVQHGSAERLQVTTRYAQLMMLRRNEYMASRRECTL